MPTRLLAAHFFQRKIREAPTRRSFSATPPGNELFGGQQDAIGKSLLLDGKSYRVVGVMHGDLRLAAGRAGMDSTRVGAIGVCFREIASTKIMTLPSCA